MINLKKYFPLLIILPFVLLNFANAQADDFPGLETVKGITICEAGMTFAECAASIFRWVINILVVIAFGLAIVFFIVGGILYITAGTNEDTQKQAKQYLIYSAVGLVAALVSWAIANILKSLLEQGIGQ